MSLNIFLDGQQLSLLAGTTLSLKLTSPLFQDETLAGTYSYSFSLPLDETNRTVFGYPDVMESTRDLQKQFTGLTVEYDGYTIGRDGELRIRRIRPGRVEAQVLFGLSRLATALKEQKLHSFAFGGVRSAGPDQVADDGTVVPGLLVLANNTVANPDSADFVFAPFLNAAHFPASADGIPTFGYVNPWVFSDVPLFGAPALGSFTNPLSQAVPGSGASTPAFRLSPLPKVDYLVRTLLQELGARPGINRLTGELAKLVLLTDTPMAGEFTLADCMPDVTPKDLLMALRHTIGLIPDINQRGEYELELLQELLASAEYDDWTDVVASEFDEREIPDVQGRHLVYQVASEDSAGAEFFAPLSQLPLGADVDTPAQLPRPTAYDPFNLPSAQVRWVRSAQRFYKSTVTVDNQAQTVAVSWAPHSGGFPAVDVAGGGEEYQQGITATAVDVLPSQFYLAVQEDALMASINQPPWSAGKPDAERGTAIRLAFYRGRQPYRISTDHPLASLHPDYPLLTPFNLNAVGDTVGDYSLQLHGPAGTVAMLLGRWLEYVAVATPTKWKVWLTPEQLAGLRLKRRKRIAGNEYFVREISLTVPQTGPAIVELIPIPANLGL